MRIALSLLAIFFPNTSPAPGDVWSLEVLERYASWVRDGGFACPLATRITEVGSDGAGSAFKVTCASPAAPVTGEEVAFRLTLRPNGSRWVELWRE